VARPRIPLLLGRPSVGAAWDPDAARAPGKLQLQTRAARAVSIVFRVDASRALAKLAGNAPDCGLP
jgi:hypothetical protein